MSSSMPNQYRGKARAFFFAIICSLPLLAHGSHTVYLIHGYGSSPFFMAGLAKYLAKEGYKTHNWGYKSLKKGLPEIGRELYQLIKSSPSDTISFVTHSMGGLVFRSMIGSAQSDTAFPTVHRVVMLAPPNKGAEIADLFKDAKLIHAMMGPNLEYMQTDSASLANTLPKPKNAEIGIIAGARFDGEGFNPLIAGDEDGFLSPEKAALGAEKELIIVPEVHILMAQTKSNRELVLRFLKSGSFQAR